MKYIKPLLSLVVACMVTSCAGRKVYVREQVVRPELYRTDNIPSDSLSSAVVAWRDIFTDPHLQEHITNALQHNLDIRTAYNNVLIARQTLLQSKHAFAPTLSVAGSYTKSTSSVNATPLVSERVYADLFSLNATASWEADIWGKLSAQTKANYASHAMSVASHIAVQSEVVATVALSYYQLLMLDKQKQLLEETITLREQSWLTTKHLKDAGSTTEVAVQQTQALLYNAQAQLIGIKNNIFTLENTLCVLMGTDPKPIARSTFDAQVFPRGFSEGFPMALLQNRPDVMRAEQALINAFEQVNMARAALYPTLRLTAQGGVSSTEVHNWFSAQSLFGNVVASLVQPLLNQRQLKTQYAIRELSQSSALLAFQKILLTAGKEVSDAMQQYHSYDAYIDLKEQEAQAYRKATEYSRELFNSGLANYLEVITAEVNRLNAELSVATAQFTKMQYGIALYKALGGGWR